MTAVAVAEGHRRVVAPAKGGVLSAAAAAAAGAAAVPAVAVADGPSEGAEEAPARRCVVAVASQQRAVGGGAHGVFARAAGHSAGADPASAIVGHLAHSTAF